MYEVEFYYDRHGKSEIVDYLDDLQLKSKTSKTDRINREKILTYIGALERFGTRIGKPYVKHIEDEIRAYEPGSSGYDDGHINILPFLPPPI